MSKANELAAAWTCGMDDAEAIAINLERAWRRLSRSKSARPEDRAAYRQAARAVHSVVSEIRRERDGRFPLSLPARAAAKEE